MDRCVWGVAIWRKEAKSKLYKGFPNLLASRHNFVIIKRGEKVFALWIDQIRENEEVQGFIWKALSCSSKVQVGSSSQTEWHFSGFWFCLLGSLLLTEKWWMEGALDSASWEVCSFGQWRKHTWSEWKNASEFTRSQNSLAGELISHQIAGTRLAFMHWAAMAFVCTEHTLGFCIKKSWKEKWKWAHTSRRQMSILQKTATHSQEEENSIVSGKRLLKSWKAKLSVVFYTLRECKQQRRGRLVPSIGLPARARAREQQQIIKKSENNKRVEVLLLKIVCGK